ncbi:MAG TPA: nucleotide exchange factor GrpE [Candidatus Coprenecus stercoravium]|uniref:Protein GrpE n=1 Tax=Candidatus Coprenecus stercoravium TaxID=2840735 RepID=A0A9D2KAA5_9BACT|nr:nucleotide exchange factor GrpE [Candidatus Coprenecus stercoravium]
MDEKEEIKEKKEDIKEAGGGVSDEAASEGSEKKKKGEKHSRKDEELKALQSKMDEVNDKYVRLAAEFDNYRRRTARERLDLISTAGEDIIKGMLPVLDDCERALQVLRESNADQAAIEGTELIYNKLMSYLKGRGLSVIDAVGKELDTDFHEAVARMPVQEEDRKNRIIDVIQPGYKLNDKVIRFAKVVVGV